MSTAVFPKSRKRTRRLRNSLIALTLLILIFCGILLQKTYRVYQSELPSFEQLHNIEPSLKTKVYDRNGVLLKEFYSENRVLTPFAELPPHLIEMLLASEDREFYDHWGINLRRVFIVAGTNLLHWEIAAGASTITQQLSRMLFLNRQQTVERKAKEALTAIKLERTYSKQEIIEMYLNQYYFGRGAYGIAAAARTFFDKEPSALTTNDCAVLIGLLKGPNINSPFKNPDKAVQARNRVLYSYYEVGGLNESEYDSLRNEPLVVRSPEEEPGIAPYFTETIRQYILDKYGESVLYSGGLSVVTSLDVDLQAAAESSLYRKVDSLRAMIERQYPVTHPVYGRFMPDTVNEFGDSIPMHRRIQCAFIAIDNSNGDVLAMVGGRSWSESKFNRAVQSYLQPGSCFKPFVYTAAIDNGYRTTDIIDDNPIVLDIPGAKQWRPHNFDNKFMGPMTIRDGIRLSRNLVAVRLILKTNPEQAIYYARQLGIKSPLPAVPSLALGTADVRLIDMVNAFSVFPNKGIRIPHRMVHRIVDRYGRVLEDNAAVQKEEVLSAQTAYVMVDLMRSVVDAGTGRRARAMGFSRPAGGKTGTSNNFCDNWFVGFTPQITAGNWVGFDEKISIGRNQDGAKNGVPPWAEFMIAAHDSLAILDFEEPDGIVRADVCIESGEIATDRCIDVRNEVFIGGTEPTVTCHLHPSSGRYDPTRAQPRPDTYDVFEDESEDTTESRMHF